MPYAMQHDLGEYGNKKLLKRYKQSVFYRMLYRWLTSSSLDTQTRKSHLSAAHRKPHGDSDYLAPRRGLEPGAS